MKPSWLPSVCQTGDACFPFFGGAAKMPLMSRPICRSPRSLLIQKEPAIDDPTRSVEYTQRQVNLVTCLDRSFVYVERDFSESYIDRFYEERAGDGYGCTQELFFWWHEATRYSNRHILKLLGPAHSRTLLEVGSGIGTFIADVRDAGWQVSGLEISAEFPAFCRKKLGIQDVRCGRIADPFFPKASFDLVAMLDVLEHMYDPLLAVSQCAWLLKPGGMLVVKSPNGPMQFRKEHLKNVRRATGYVANIGHISQFAPRTLSLLFRKCGLVPTTILPAKSFQQGITGDGFTPRRMARRKAVIAAKQVMQLTGVGVNLVGIARKEDCGPSRLS